MNCMSAIEKSWFSVWENSGIRERGGGGRGGQREEREEREERERRRLGEIVCNTQFTFNQSEKQRGHREGGGKEGEGGEGGKRQRVR